MNEPSPMYDVPTEDLAKEVSGRYDLFFMVGMKADPGPEDEPFDYWITSPYPATAVLTQYALSHYAIQQVKAGMLSKEDTDHA